MRLIEIKKHYVPKGPSFKTVEEISFTLSGTEIQLSLPPHKSASDLYKEKPPKSHYDIYTQNHYRTDPDTGILILPVLTRDWTFRGSWLVGALARLSIEVEVIRHPINGADFTLFHPPTFEELVLDTLTRLYGDEILCGRSIFTAPYNWRRITLGEHAAISYEVLPHLRQQRRMIVAMPIANGHYLNITFSERKLVEGTRKRKDALIASAPIEALVAKVISTVKIDLAEDALADKAEAARRWPELDYSASREPLKWTTPEQDEQWRLACTIPGLTW